MTATLDSLLDEVAAGVTLVPRVDQPPSDNQTVVVDAPTSDSQLARDVQTATAVGSSSDADQSLNDTKALLVGVGPLLVSPTLGIAADVLDDVEHVRCANENRVRQLTDTTERGFGLDHDHPSVAEIQTLVDSLKDVEARAIKDLERQMKKHPLGGPWVKETVGVGAKQGARVLAVIRDPAWHDRENRPRTFGELVAYCGLHVVEGAAPRRARGQRSNWNESARKRLWLIAAKSIMFSSSPYRPIYDEAKAKHAEALHTVACVRCGGKASPAAVGTELSAGHRHGRALRAVMRAILHDVYDRAVKLHEEASATNGKTSPETASSSEAA